MSLTKPVSRNFAWVILKVAKLFVFSKEPGTEAWEHSSHLCFWQNDTSPLWTSVRTFLGISYKRNHLGKWFLCRASQKLGTEILCLKPSESVPLESPGVAVLLPAWISTWTEKECSLLQSPGPGFKCKYDFACPPKWREGALRILRFHALGGGPVVSWLFSTRPQYLTHSVHTLSRIMHLVALCSRALVVPCSHCVDPKPHLTRPPPPLHLGDHPEPLNLVLGCLLVFAHLPSGNFQFRSGSFTWILRGLRLSLHFTYSPNPVLQFNLMTQTLNLI